MGNKVRFLKQLGCWLGSSHSFKECVTAHVEATLSLVSPGEWAVYFTHSDGLTYSVYETVKTDYTPLSVYINEEAVCGALGLASFAKLISGMNATKPTVEFYGLNADCSEYLIAAKDGSGSQAGYTANNKGGGWWRISDSKAPESTGSNAILLNNAAGKTVTASFEGLYEMQGSTYKCGPESNAGWRYGFVSYNSDGSTTYSEIFRESGGNASFNVPSNSSKLWFVVSGAPLAYERHAWPTEASKSDTDTDDNKWPWKVSFSGTRPSGK